MLKNNRNYRNKEAEVLWVIVVSLLTALWIIVCPFIVRSYVAESRRSIRTDMMYRHPIAEIQANLIYDCAELSSYVIEEIPHYFYETRHTVKRVCTKLKELPQWLFAEETPPVVYEQTIWE